jgi:hypothetical protein
MLSIAPFVLVATASRSGGDPPSRIRTTRVREHALDSQLSDTLGSTVGP